GDAAAAADEHLADHGLQLLRRLREVARIDRHIAPSEQHLTLVLDRALDLVLAGDARGGVAGQEHHAYAVLPRRRQLHALLRHLVAEVTVRNLDQEARAVGELRVVAHRAAVRQVAQHGEALLDDGVRLLALDVRYEANAAGIVLLGRVVEALRPRGVLIQVHGGTDKYTITALQRQWPLGCGPPRRRRAARRGRALQGPQSAASPAPPSCHRPSAP